MIIELIQLQLQLLVAAHSQHQHEQKIRNAKPARMWQLPLIQYRHRFKKGAYHNLLILEMEPIQSTVTMTILECQSIPLTILWTKSIIGNSIPYFII